MGIDQWHYYGVAGEKPREIAAQLLVQRQGGEFVEVLLDRVMERGALKPEDRRFLQELVYGAVRWQLTLDWLINQKTGANPQKALVQNLLRLALYQMFWLDRVPSYAAVNETVEIAKRKGLVPQAKFINAVLRGYGREVDATRAKLAEFKTTNFALGFSHPEWLCQKWEKCWGKEKTIHLLEWNNSTPATFARVNTLKTTRDALLKQWEKENVAVEDVSLPWIPAGTVFRILKHSPLPGLESFQQGFFYVQDPSTLLAVEIFDPQPGDTVLDLCAAPGGKTTYIAQKMKNQGRIVAEDIHPKRLKLVAANCARLGVAGVSIDPAPSVLFDRILVDAPCSNTGVMRRRVELRWRVTPEEVHRLSKLQLNILHTAAKRLRPGGSLVYSTCSLESEENGAVIREFLSLNPKFKLETERSLTPGRDGTDGAYCARLRWG
jgi:16S rRNA (cytosine967-C5)-methyltransferase